MWLPDAGIAPHRGVVDAGEVRGEVNLLDWLAHRWFLGVRRRRSGWRGGAGRAARAGCAAWYAVRNSAATLQFGHQPVGDLRAGRAAGRRAAAGSRSARPRATPAAGRRAAPECPRRLRRRWRIRRRRARRVGAGGRGASASSSRKTTRSAKTCTGVRRARGASPRGDGLDDGVGVRGVVRGDEADVGAAAMSGVRPLAVAQRGDDRLALRRSRRDRRSLDREPRCPRSRCSAACSGRRTGRWRRRGSRRRPPSCPTAGAAPRRSRRPRRAASSRGFGTPGARPKWRAAAGLAVDLHPDAGPAGADVVERGDGLRQVEGLGVGGDGGRAADRCAGCSGATRAAISTASSRPRTRSVRSSGRVGGLQCQRVLDGDEVEQTRARPR